MDNVPPSCTFKDTGTGVSGNDELEDGVIGNNEPDDELDGVSGSDDLDDGVGGNEFDDAHRGQPLGAGR